MDLIKEIFFTFVINVFITIFSFLINKYFIFCMGIDNFGLMKFFTQLVTYLNLLESGLVFASTYALYKPLSEKDNKKISIIINTISEIYNRIFLFVLLIGLIFNFLIPFLLKDNLKYIYLYWSLYVFNAALFYRFAKYRVLFLADQKFLLIKIIQGSSKLFCQLMQIIVIIKLQSFLIFILLLILDSIIQYIFYKWYYQKYYKNIFKTNLKEISIRKDMKKLFWHKIAEFIVFNTDLLLISKFLSLKIVGIYSNYQLVLQTIVTVLNMIFSIFRGKIGKFIAENRQEEVFKCWKRLNILFLFFSIIFSFSIYILINQFIKLWLNNNFIFNKFTVFFMCINLFINCFRGITDIFKEGSGFFDDIYLPISEALINFVASIILVQYIGLNGVIIGTIVSNILIICIAKPILVFKRCFDKNVKDYITIYGNYLILIIVSLLSCNFILKFISLKIVNSWFDWIINGIIVGSITFIVTFVIFLSNKDFRNDLEFLKKSTSK